MRRFVSNQRVLLAAFLGAIGLSGCQNLPPAPEHKYYRLLAAPLSPAAQAVRLSGSLTVRPLRAEGLYRERAMVFSDERQLRQYHYSHWLYPPGQLVQEHLAEHLRLAAVAPAVRLQDRGAETPYAVSGRIARFEKITVAGRAKASVALELRLEKQGRLVWQQTYVADQAVVDATMNAYSAATETALERIYAQFLGDLGHIRLD